MKRMTVFLVTLALGLVSFLEPSVAAAKGRELELRGTLLCRTEGDARRERPMDAHYLVIEPVGYPGNTEMLGEAGLFRVRVPYDDVVDHQIVLKIYRGSESVDVIQAFIEPGKVRRMGDKFYYPLTSHVLPGRCEDMVGNADLALAFRDQLRMSAITADRGAGGISKPAAGGIVATLLGAGAYAASAATGSSAQFKGNNLVPETSPIVPGDWPVYSQFSSSPALGRTLTSFRHFGEAAFWNPSVMVRQPGHHLSASGGMRNEWRAAGAYRIPYRSGDVSPFLPRVVTAGFNGYIWSKEVELGVPGIVSDLLENHHEERSIHVGLGFELSPDVSFGVNLHDYRQHFGVVETVDQVDENEEDVAFDNRIRRARQDVDLGLTWDPSSEFRVALATYSVGGSEALNADNREVPLARGVIGAAWIRDRFSAGAEVGMNAGRIPVAVGLNYKVTPWLGLDLSAADRYDTFQTGLDFTPGRFRGTFRVRWDDYESGALHLGAGMGW
jgi:hypothetical protein